MILIITNTNDYTSDYLITKLIDRGERYLRINSETITHSNITYLNDSLKISCKLKKKTHEYDITNINSVWFRRLIRPEINQRIAKEYNNFCYDETRAFLEGLFFSIKAKWINPVHNVLIAERKALQLTIARDLGLLIPDTIISNDADELRSFTESHERIICKPIHSGLIKTTDETYSIHTTEVHKHSFYNNKSLDLCPTLVQHLIEKKADLRLTIVGDSAFPVEITTPGIQALDWRKHHRHLSHKLVDIDNDTLSKCKMMLKKLGLIYGAFDFGITTDNELVFFEINPTGEWVWLESTLNLDISSAIIDNLKSTYAQD